MRAAVALAALLPLDSVLVRSAWAQVASSAAPTSEELAEQKFREGRAAQDKGLYREALRLFEESVRIKSSPATLLNLGNCHVQLGELMKALAAFQLAHEDAQNWKGSDELRNQWEQEAQGHIEDLSQSIPELILRPSPSPGVSVQLNHNPVQAFNQPLRLDPGRYQIELTAAQKRPFSQEFVLALGQKLEIALPPLEDVVPVPAAEQTVLVRDTAPPDESDQSNVLPWALMGGGAALVAGSLIPGLMANSKANELEQACPSKQNCDPALQDERDSAATLAVVSDVLWITGLVSAGVGVTLFVLDLPSGDQQAALDDATRMKLRAGCFESGCGVSARGRF